MEIPEQLRAHMNRPLPPVIDQVRQFLLGFVADCEGLDELRKDLTRIARQSQRGVRREVEAIEALLAAPQPPGTLSNLVAWYGNWVLDDQTSDAEAEAWLRDLAVLIREVLADNAGNVGGTETS
ncbi:hypothetical protein [Nocardia sp. CDC160]|uniref:hypothetical protein n=1 Tax=Nocardia sp. CDC160 TaxID=3112166 RepID=UPI002DBBB6BE|nr:hypothetical protein [Nocardia sp. CDC160]MEC3913303.1 hypothetical protein [Nocardia sp. CDC160]